MDLEPPAFLFLSHRFDGSIVRAFGDWCRAARQQGDCWLLTSVPVGAAKVGAVGAGVHAFETASLQHRLGFAAISPGIVPGNTHFPVFDFFRQHPRHSHYWLVEYDVRFGGSWSEFFRTVESEPADFLTCHLRRHGLKTRTWHWWDIDHPTEHLAFANRIAAFHPLYRISHRAMASLDRELQTGWRGHSEILLASLIARMGFSLCDFAANGEFPAVANGQFCTPHRGECELLKHSTMRYRPGYCGAVSGSNRLYHPVKSGPDLVWAWLQYCSVSVRLLGRQIAGRSRQRLPTVRGSGC